MSRDQGYYLEQAQKCREAAEQATSAAAKAHWREAERCWLALANLDPSPLGGGTVKRPRNQTEITDGFVLSQPEGSSGWANGSGLYFFLLLLLAALYFAWASYRPSDADGGHSTEASAEPHRINHPLIPT